MKNERGADCDRCAFTTPFTFVDCCLTATILAFGILQFIFAQRAHEFYGGDASYFELAQSILHGSYGFNFRLETMLPPGLPAILAMLLEVFGNDRLVLIRSVIVFETLAFGVAYLLLKREEGRGLAAAVTALLLASDTTLRLTTRAVLSDVPYMFTSLVALLAFMEIDQARTRRHARLWFVAGLFFLTTSLLIRTSGIALLAGLLIWLIISSVREPGSAGARLRTYSPLIVAGLLVQSSWMIWVRKNEPPAEWPIEGYPRSYMSQLLVKNGNEPERGFATAADLPERVERNVVDRTVGLVEALTGKGGRLPHPLYAPWALIPVVFISIGLGRSIRRSGGRAYDWYFLVHEGIYLLWPWDFEARFLLPVAPLACLYVGRGVTVVAHFVRKRPNMAAGIVALTSMLCAGLAIAGPGHSTGFRDSLAWACWLVALAGSAAFLCWTRFQPERASRVVPSVFSMSTVSRRTLACAATVGAITLNTCHWGEIGRDNLTFDIKREPTYPQIVAAEWIREHSPSNTVVMARQMDVVYHYSHRKVVWFPPISDPESLMAGIERHHVHLILILDRGANTYWRPAERDCFGPLIDRYPTRFRLVQSGPREWVFAVVSRNSVEASAALQDHHRTLTTQTENGRPVG